MRRAGLPWFRLYAELIDDPKCQRLPPALFKTWINVLCLACQSGGRLPSIDDIAFRLRLSVNDADLQLSDLILAGLIDIDPSGARVPHNWSSRQFVSDTSTERVRRHRIRRNGAKRACNGGETLHGTPPDTESDSEQIQTQLQPRAIDGIDEKEGMALVADLARWEAIDAAEAREWLADMAAEHGPAVVATAGRQMRVERRDGRTPREPRRLWRSIALRIAREAGAAGRTQSPTAPAAAALTIRPCDVHHRAWIAALPADLQPAAVAAPTLTATALWPDRPGARLLSPVAFAVPALDEAAA